MRVDNSFLAGFALGCAVTVVIWILLMLLVIEA